MTAAAVSVRYQFAGYELHPEERRLLAGGHAVHLGPHAFDLLVKLVERGGRLVSKDELLAQVWPRVVVEENTLQAHISSLRKALGANAITTVSGRGYRFNLDVAEISASRPSAPAPTRNNLPHPLTSFIGREEVLAELQQLSGRTRLLTLTGAGGCGKTRLAIQLARHQLHAHPDGMWLVELAALTDPKLLPQTAADVLGVKEQAGAALIDTIAGLLASRAVLLLLDNAEHLLDACAEFAEALLRRCERLVVLVTSRERLGIMGELTYRVPSLSVPGGEDKATPETVAACEATCLFVERARLQVPDFEVTPRNAVAIGSICRQLDGIPLAIELAAPRVRSMSIDDLRERLDQRFRLLTEGSRTALPRQRTLRSLVDWSYDLLDDAEKAMLCRLSVFSGGCTLEAAEQVCGAEGVKSGEVSRLLTSLVEKNLVGTERSEGATRYHLLETMRRYGWERLCERGEDRQTQARHFACYLALAEEAKPRLNGAEVKTWLDRLGKEHDNFRAVFGWCTAEGGDAEGGMSLAEAFWEFWTYGGYQGEGRAWVSRLLTRAPNASPAARRKALRVGGVLAFRQGDYSTARSMHEEGLAIERKLGLRLAISISLSDLANAAYLQEDYSSARALYEESLPIYRELGNEEGVAVAQSNLGCLDRDQGDYLAAQARFDAALEIARKIGKRGDAGIVLTNLGELALARGDYQAARSRFEESLVILHQLGYGAMTCGALEGLADVASATGEPLRAARIWGRSARSREELGVPLESFRGAHHEKQVAAGRAALGGAAFDHAWEEGRSLELDDAVRLAMGGAMT